MENVVAKHEAGRVITNEILANDKGLCQTVGRGLFGIGEIHSKIRAVAQQALESRKVLGS